jgi:predicted regulator of Ras-like GTPase activity (Roadblock/LC7/MglB family)
LNRQVAKSAKNKLVRNYIVEQRGISLENNRTSSLIMLLAEIQNAVPSLVNAALTTTDGLWVATLLPGSYDDDVAIARTAVVLSSANQLLKTLRLGSVQEIVILAIEYAYVIVPVTDEIFLEALLDDRTAVPYLIAQLQLNIQPIAHVWEELNMRYG